MPEYVHQFDLDDQWTDEEIWNYAKDKGLIIITKDADFSHKIMLSDPPPKVIHLRIGNMKLKELYYFLNKTWEDILKLIDKNKLVNVYRDRIETVN